MNIKKLLHTRSQFLHFWSPRWCCKMCHYICSSETAEYKRWKFFALKFTELHHILGQNNPENSSQNQKPCIIFSFLRKSSSNEQLTLKAEDNTIFYFIHSVLSIHKYEAEGLLAWWEQAMGKDVGYGEIRHCEALKETGPRINFPWYYLCISRFLQCCWTAVLLLNW